MGISLPLLCLLSVCALVSVRAEIIYDNSANGGTNTYYSNLEYGDEVMLAGTSRVMTQFQFEYYGDFVATGLQTARLRVYKNDGPGDYPGPGTVLYDSGAFPLSPGYQVKTFSGLDVTVPTDITWTIQFSGLIGATGDRAGLIFRNPPSVGSSFDDFWLKTASGWQLFNKNGDPVANFAARISSGVDPTTVAVRRDGAKVVVEWTGSSVLQISSSVAGPFSDLLEAHNKYEFDPGTAEAKFWRLKN